jgi:DNA polymerase delta subunit 1
VITKGLGKKTEAAPPDAAPSKPPAGNHHAKQAHVELAERMRKRDEATAPSVGDRVAYVMIKAAKGSKGYEKSEDPLYVLQNNLPIDFEFYLEHQVKQPLLRIFEPVFPNAEDKIFVGEHTRNKYVPKMATSSGLGKFTVVKKTCLGCKNVLPNEMEVLCERCQAKKKQIYI